MQKSLGQIAYEAYLESSKGRSYCSLCLGGASLPVWEGLASSIQTAWEAAADAVTAALLKKIPESAQ